MLFACVQPSQQATSGLLTDLWLSSLRLAGQLSKGKQGALRGRARPESTGSSGGRGWTLPPRCLLTVSCRTSSLQQAQFALSQANPLSAGHLSLVCLPSKGPRGGRRGQGGHGCSGGRGQILPVVLTCVVSSWQQAVWPCLRPTPSLFAGHLTQGEQGASRGRTWTQGPWTFRRQRTEPREGWLQRKGAWPRQGLVSSLLSDLNRADACGDARQLSDGLCMPTAEQWWL